MDHTIFLPVIYIEKDMSNINSLLSFVYNNIKIDKKIIMTVYGNKIDKGILCQNINLDLLDDIYICKNEIFDYDENVYVDAISQHINILKPTMVLSLSDSFYKSILSRIAARFLSGIVVDSLSIIYDDKKGCFSFLKPAYGNNVHAVISIKDSPITFATIKIRENVECLYKKDGANIKEIAFDKECFHSNITLIEKIFSQTIDNNLESAKIVIGVGRGIKKKENLTYAFELAKLLNAAVGVTRPLVDEGWIDKSYQIGQTGKMISPDIYIAFGISGAAHHICGINKPKILIAVNNDKEANIFNIADYGIVGDATDHIKKFIYRIKERINIC